MARKALSPGSDVGPYIIRETISQDNSGMTYLAERVDSPPDAEAQTFPGAFDELEWTKVIRGVHVAQFTFHFIYFVLCDNVQHMISPIKAQHAW